MDYYYSTIASLTSDGTMKNDHYSLELKRRKYNYYGCKVLIKEGKYSMRVAFTLDLFCSGRLVRYLIISSTILAVQQQYLLVTIIINSVIYSA